MTRILKLLKLILLNIKKNYELEYYYIPSSSILALTFFNFSGLRS